ncbi:T9SS type B sorting domain-containing protein [Gelidibacter mesophilus]|uniref:T9SS type B sorting domain-containing protein n=1 Tax=Gelidibacter mesophilus TaxID=169050 RepID=UPI0003FF76EF|nr:T9SS type B sorting domain-containing protein [Gelidibacter mesophilus]
MTLVGTVAVSQNESANWYFGEFAGLSFNSGTPRPLLNSQLNTDEGCATISSPEGNLLFYTDGTTVWNRQHQRMLNGSNLMGHSSSTMSALIIPKPGNRDAFYIFTVDMPSYYLTQRKPINGINYSEVDMTLDNGLGGIVDTKKNTHLITYNVNDPIENEYKTSEKITAVTHSNGNSIWVITQFTNKFYAFHVDDNGVNLNPVISTVSNAVYPRLDKKGSNISAIGYLKVSPNGKKIAIAHSSTALGGKNTGSKNTGEVLLYDFNNTTGTVSNQKEIINGTYPYGVEFSPNSKLLYITTGNFTTEDIFISSNVFQYGVETLNVSATQKTIHTSNFVAGALQLAIDGKIYRAGYKVFGEGTHLSVINKPNEIGAASDYRHNVIQLGGKASKLGLPPFIQSIFKFTFDYKNTCLGDTTEFSITTEDPYDTAFWDFGDGQTSTALAPEHTFSQPGAYNVSLSLTLNGVTNDPFIKTIIISEPPAVLPTPFELVQCDSFDQDPNDGIATFNLELANGPLTYHTTAPISVYYYHTEADALNDENLSTSLDPIYRNKYQQEILIAKVYKAGTKCFSLATIKLTTVQSTMLSAFELFGCDPQNNGHASFNLETARQTIIADLNLPNNVSVSFHQTLSNAAIGIKPIPDDFQSTATTLYIRAQSDDICYGSGLLHLKIKPFPGLENQMISVCQTDFPIVLNSGVAPYQIDSYNYLWGEGQTTNSIEVHEAGTYQLQVKDPILSCETTITLTVVQNEIASIKNISVDANSATITLNPSIEGFEFAIDNEFGTYQTSNQFPNLTPGTHTVFVRDVYQCTTISKVFYNIGFPKFFTPNNDGINDFWNIKGLDPNTPSNNLIKIFDRYGKLLFYFNPLQSKGWDGTYNGQLLSPDDYWYIFKLSEDITHSGHFSLKI